ncbi:MAG: TonB-dependent receptor [Sterolibacteriaceae bacterium MAG5]|nr:TonB-dependent receptor [Candidatus Nitricoxidireducens bremensis]
MSRRSTLRAPATLLSLLAFALAGPADADTALPDVEISAERDDFERRKDARSTRLVYGREELDRMNELTVGDYLRRLPGVTFTGPPGNPADVRVRGMDKGYTQILIDGDPVPTGTKERQLQVDRLSLDMVERIEIIRAPTADMPNEGLAGTINIVLRDVPEAPLANARIVGGQLFGEKASPETWNASGQYSPGGKGDVRWLFSASVGQRGNVKSKSKSEETFTAATGVRNAWKFEYEDERVRSDGIDLSPRASIRLSPEDELVVTPFLSSTIDNKTKTVDKYKYNTPATAANYVGDGSKTEVEDKERRIYRLRSEWKRKLAGGGSFSLFGVLQSGGEDKDKTAREFSAAGAQTKITLEAERKIERDNFVGFRSTLPHGDHKPGFGMEFGEKSRRDRKDTFENGVLKATGRGDAFTIGERRWVAYVQDEITLRPGHYLTPGLRAQWLRQESTDGLGQSRAGSVRAATPSAHYLWQVDGANNLRASVTKTLKPPKFDELSTTTETKTGSSADPDKSGNPDLRPESAVGLELAWEHFLPRGGGVLGANFFNRQIKDKIEERTLAEGARYVTRPYNVGEARVWGVELDARPRMDIIGMPELMLRFNYTRLYSELKDAATGLTTRIKDQPPFVYNVGFDWQLPSWDGAVGMNYNYTPRFIKNPAEPLKPDPEGRQRLLDLYVMKRLSRDLAVRVTASNLVDMRKDKDKYEYDTQWRMTKKTLESERGGRSLMVALEARW